MVGSADSIACANIMLNTAVAESLRVYADRLEKAENFEETLHGMIRKTIRDHKRIIFNGNGYDENWIEEASARGLCNFRTTADCLPHLLDSKNVELLKRHGVYSETELKARYEALLEAYCKTILIEAKTMLMMVKTQILPSIGSYAADVAAAARAKKEICPSLACAYETGIVETLSALTDRIAEKVRELDQAVCRANAAPTAEEQAVFIRDTVRDIMTALRAPCDEAETIVSKDAWPMPTYAEILFSTR